MCDTCPCNVSGSSIPGPAEVAGGVLGAAVGAALTKPGRKVMFWGFTIPMVLGIIVYTVGWWLLPIAVGLLAAAAGVLLAVRRMQRLAVVTRPELTHEMRAKLAARNLRPIPAPAQAALPRGLSITRKRRALPAPAKALPAPVVTGTVVPAPVRGKVGR